MSTPNPEQPAPTPWSPGDFAWLDECDALATKSPVMVVKLFKNGNAAVWDEAENRLRDTGTQRLTRRLVKLNAAKQPVPDAGVREPESVNDMTTAELPAATRGHSPLPWRVRSSIRQFYVGVEHTGSFESGSPVCSMDGGTAMGLANAALIVHAVNSLLSSRKSISEPSPAPTPATSEDTLMLDWLEKHRHVTLSHWENGCMVELFHEQYWNDRHNQRDDRFCKTYRELLRYQLAEESKYAMAHAGEQKT